MLFIPHDTPVLSIRSPSDYRTASKTKTFPRLMARRFPIHPILPISQTEASMPE